MDEFEYKGFKYRIVSMVDATVELIYAGYLTGKVVVPEEVEYQNLKCKVVGIRGASKDDKRFPVFVGQRLESFQDKLEVVLPKSLKEIGDYAFYDCYNLVSVNIPNSVTSIGGFAFSGCSSLTSVTIGNSVTSIGLCAFSPCPSLTSVHITDLAAWCGKSFNKCPFDQDYKLYLNGELVIDLVIPDGVTSIGYRAFSGCSSLTSVTIGNSVTSIGDEAFSVCKSLTSVTIGNSVKSIEKCAFWGCDSLTSVTIENKKGKVAIGKNAFPSKSKINYPTLLTKLFKLFKRSK